MKIFFIKLATILCTIEMLVRLCKCIDLIDLADMDPYQPRYKSKAESAKFEESRSENLPPKPIRKYWLLNEQPRYTKGPISRVYEDEKDTNLKQKIANLVDQTMRDTQKKMKKTEEIKDDHREESPYKVGFILCMIKKSKNVMDELFNVAVKHKEQWKSLQHLKVFELIVHTNVDTTNLLRQLVDVHLKHMNSTQDAKRVTDIIVALALVLGVPVSQEPKPNDNLQLFPPSVPVWDSRVRMQSFAKCYTVQVIVQHCNSLNLIDLPQSRDDFSATWKLASRAPEMYEPYPRQIGMNSYVRRYMLGNDRTTNNRHVKPSRRVFEDEKDVNLKNKLSALVKQAMRDTEEKIKEVDPIKEKYSDEPPYKVGFVLSMVKKSREVLNELFNVAIKHRDEWQALEQLKIFEMIVNTNIDTNHLLKLLQDIQAGREPAIFTGALKTTEKRIEVTTQATRLRNNEIKVEIENDTDSKVE